MAEALRFRALEVGDTFPTFTARSNVNPHFKFDTVGGRYVVLALLGTVTDPAGQAALALVREHAALFDDEKLAFFGVIAAPGDEASDAYKAAAKEFRFFLDFDGAVSKQCGALPDNDETGQIKLPYWRLWAILDPMLRVISVIPFEQDGSDRARLTSAIKSLRPLDNFAGFDIPVPVLVLPNLFEPDFCKHLIGLYNQHGGEESGFMREVNGKTVPAQDHAHKRRSDYTVDDPQLSRVLQTKIQKRVVPQIAKVHQFTVTRMERYIVGCYDSASGGHFRAHRDNTTKGTAHRRFALSVNLNDDFDGGEVSFPEYGPRSFKAPAGGGVVFSCSLMHAVSPVKRGQRYAFLPFLYDDEDEKIREANNQFLGENVGSYKLG
jgi:predicted 2-oxoglutarate/Fe(II)-dependent dioxygenase YbiX/peroxiredoxin